MAKKRSGKSNQALSTLDPRRQQFLAARSVPGATDKSAALAAGFPMSSALNSKNKVWTPSLREQFAIMVRKAIPEKKIIQRLSEGMDAKKTEFAKFEGRITDKRDCVDYEQRRKYLELAAEFSELVPRSGESATNNFNGPTQINVNLDWPL